MSWLLLLLIFWKPIYNSIMWATTKDTTYETTTKTWFSNLWALVAP